RVQAAYITPPRTMEQLQRLLWTSFGRVHHWWCGVRPFCYTSCGGGGPWTNGQHLQDCCTAPHCAGLLWHACCSGEPEAAGLLTHAWDVAGMRATVRQCVPGRLSPTSLRTESSQGGSIDGSWAT
ncbi:unnamed protein product, partial [Pleuronectes platessa]